jgi:hypothetical protein
MTAQAARQSSKKTIVEPRFLKRNFEVYPFS